MRAAGQHAADSQCCQTLPAAAERDPLLLICAVGGKLQEDFTAESSGREKLATESTVLRCTQAVVPQTSEVCNAAGKIVC